MKKYLSLFILFNGGSREGVMGILGSKKALYISYTVLAALTVAASAGCTVNKAGNPDIHIPDIVAEEPINGVQAKALCFGYTWGDSNNNTADTIPSWRGVYRKENTLVIDGEMGQNMITLSAENPKTASYVIYLLDGTIYDNGTRDLHDSLSSRLYRTDNGAGIGIIAPFVPGEYIYEVTIEWELSNLRVIYGIKVVMTGMRNAYDDALSDIWHYYSGEALSVRLDSIQEIPNAGYAGECYIFEVELPDHLERVAVSKKLGIFFIHSGDNWFEAD